MKINIQRVLIVEVNYFYFKHPIIDRGKYTRQKSKGITSSSLKVLLVVSKT